MSRALEVRASPAHRSSRAMFGLAALLALLCAARSPTAAAAQALVDDVAAYPLRRLPVVLTAGQQYEFRTTTLTGTAPDTVLSLRSTSGTALGNQVAGADGCAPLGGGTFSWLPSCFTYTPATSGTYWLFLYAYTDASFGTATVQSRNVTAGQSYSGGSTVTFGGSRAALNVPSGTGRVRLETTNRPGNVSSHFILMARAGWEWQTAYAGIANSGRIGGTAELDQNLAASGLAPGDYWIYFGTIYSGQIGDTRLVRNDFFNTFVDWDHDGLSLALESDETGTARVGSCDRPTQVLANGFSCRNVGARTHYECLVDTDPECPDSLRDTDHDGVRDDLEVYGYNSTMLELPRYGANPARMDVFLELDGQDQDPAANCQSFNSNYGTFGYLGWIGRNGLNGSGYIPHDFMAGEDNVFANAPSWLNPNGVSGIELHIDAGLPNPAQPRETRYGAWLGGNSCVPDSCGHINVLLGTCPGGTYFQPERRWLFLYALDVINGGGSAGVGSAGYTASVNSAHIHELGHAAMLAHGGPFGTSAGMDFGLGFPGEGWAEGNYRPSFVSRMNYRYDAFGGYEGNVDRSGVFGALGGYVDFSFHAFSGGSMGAIVNRRDLAETCPFPGVAPSSWAMQALGEGFSEASFDDIAVSGGTCANVDWNGDGDIAPAGSTRHVRVNESYRAERRRFLEREAGVTYQLGGNSAVIVNGVMMVAYARCASGVCGARLRGDGNGDCSRYPILPDSPGWDLTTGSYPACFPHGTHYDAASAGHSVAAMTLAPYRSDGTSGTPDRVLELYTRSSGTIYRAGFNPMVSPSDPHEFVGAPTAFTVGTTTAAVTGLRAGLGSIRVPGTNTILVVYSPAAGAMRQFSIDPVANTESANVACTDLAGFPLAAADSGASLAIIGGRVWMARLEAPASSGVIGLYRLENTGTVSTRRWEGLAVRVPNSPPLNTLPLSLAQPSLVVSPDYDIAGAERVMVMGRRSDGLLMVDISPPTTVPLWWQDPQPTGTEAWRERRVFVDAPGFDEGASFTVSGVWDTRVFPGGSSGLRIYRTMVASLGQAVLELDPFGDGADESFTTDYNEWDALQFGFCHAVESLCAWAPTGGTGPYNPTSYAIDNRCGDQPNYLEPTATGLVSTSRGNGHRAAEPLLYIGGGNPCP